MNWDQIAALIRQIIPFIGGFAVAKGYISAEQLTGIVGAIVAVGGVIWSLVANRPASIAASAQALPGVTVNTTAAAGPSVVAAVDAAKAHG